MIRASTPEDWTSIVAVYDSAKPDELLAAGVENGFVSLRDDVVAREGFKEFNILVSTDETGQVVGFGGYKDDQIGWLFVHHESRKRGIGRGLLRAMIERMPPRIWLLLLRGNSVAFTLYISEGFVPLEGAKVLIQGKVHFALKLVRNPS